jgi:hypothetical protein
MRCWEKEWMTAALRTYLLVAEGVAQLRAQRNVLGSQLPL